MMFCIPKNQLKALLEREVVEFLDEERLKFSKKGMSLEEMVKQQTEESGLFDMAVTVAIEGFTNKTENVEVHLAIALANIYDFGPPEQVTICFEMKSKFDGQINSLNDLTANIENYTHVDCAIQSSGDEWRFQIKRYASTYLDFTTEGIVSYLEKTFAKYGDMASTKLILLLKPDTQEAAMTQLDFKAIHERLTSMTKSISFSEVGIVFNENMKTISLVSVFPDYKKGKTPLQFLSPKYKDIQKNWADEMRRQQKAIKK